MSITIRSAEQLRIGIFIGLMGAAGLVACDDKPKIRSTATPAALGKTRSAKAPRRRRKVRKPTAVLELTEQDFVESPANRDPFRSYMAVIVQQAQATVPDQRPAKLDKYAVDELRLIAVVTGDVRARAMFRDPKGTGVTVRRGDLISKSRARVKLISESRVVVEITEQYEGGQKVADRVIELHKKK